MGAPVSHKTKEIRFSDVFDLEEIQRIQNLFSDATGVASIITLPDGTPVTSPSNFCRLCNDIIRKTEKGVVNCLKSDAALGKQNPSGPIIRPCLSGGLWDAGASISVGGKHIANWLIGQVRNEELDIQQMIRYADEIGVDKEDFLKALNEVPVMSLEQFTRVSQMLFTFANQLSEKGYTNLQLKKEIADHEKSAFLLKESEENYKAIIQSQSEGIGFVNNNEVFEFANLASGKIFETEANELIGASLFDFLPPSEIERIKRQTRNRKKGITETYELQIITKKGNTRYIQVSATPKFDVDGNYLGAYGVFGDITERQKADQALKEYEKQLIKLNDDKDRFISILAHDLKTPFNSLLGLSEMVLKNFKKYDPDEIETFLNLFHKSARSTYNLLEDLLMWARAQSGSLTFNPLHLNFAEICREITEFMQLTADSKGITIRQSFAEEVLVYADIEMLKTVMRNLISNAIKFTNHNGWVEISVEQANSATTIKVSDNGIGIAPATISKLFDISQMYTSKGTADESGTGLGLLLCKEFIEKHKGTIRIESEPGKGSTFYFTLPDKF